MEGQGKNLGTLNWKKRVRSSWESTFGLNGLFLLLAEFSEKILSSYFFSFSKGSTSAPGDHITKLSRSVNYKQFRKKINKLFIPKQRSYFCTTGGAAMIFAHHLMPQSVADPRQSVELHQTFQWRSNDWATAPRLVSKKLLYPIGVALQVMAKIYKHENF